MKHVTQGNNTCYQWVQKDVPARYFEMIYGMEKHDDLWHEVIISAKGWRMCVFTGYGADLIVNTKSVG